MAPSPPRQGGGMTCHYAAVVDDAGLGDLGLLGAKSIKSGPLEQRFALLALLALSWPFTNIGPFLALFWPFDDLNPKYALFCLTLSEKIEKKSFFFKFGNKLFNKSEEFSHF